MTTPAFEALGHDVRRAITADELETFPAPPGLENVVFTSSELTAFCPVTSQPDFYTVHIDISNPTACIESKSLKLYLMSYRDVGAFAETLAVDIARDVQRKSGGGVRVRLDQQIRGGLELIAVGAWYTTSDEDND
jgi:7-cyano-7-deazaguanine reductase